MSAEAIIAITGAASTALGSLLAYLVAVKKVSKDRQADEYKLITEQRKELYGELDRFQQGLKEHIKELQREMEALKKNERDCREDNRLLRLRIVDLEEKVLRLETLSEKEPPDA